MLASAASMALLVVGNNIDFMKKENALVSTKAFQKFKPKSTYARVTLPERRQRVQALIRVGVPLTIALTRFTLGFHARLERRWE